MTVELSTLTDEALLQSEQDNFLTAREKTREALESYSLEGFARGLTVAQAALDVAIEARCERMKRTLRKAGTAV